MKYHFLGLLPRCLVWSGLAPGLLACSGLNPTEELDWQTVSVEGYTLAVTEPDEPLIPLLLSWGADGRAQISGFFGREFQQSYTIRVFGDRTSLQAHWHDVWHATGLDQSCAAARSQEVTLLSPRSWTAAPCVSYSTGHVQRVLSHELVHVLHEQWNPELGHTAAVMPWLVEGLAVYGSGQLEREYADQVLALVRSGQQPTRLAAIWQSSVRYGVAGSVVKYIGQLIGRPALADLFAANDEASVLAAVGRSESDLMAGWRASVVSFP